MKKGTYERRLSALEQRRLDLAAYETTAKNNPLAANVDKIQMVKKEIEVLEERINAERPISVVEVEQSE